jgi:uncharacterized small protein (DUF1192 family)
MIQVTADDRSLLSDLCKFVEPVEVLEPNGEVAGLFVPANLERSKRRDDPRVAHIDWAEIERRKAQETGKGRKLYEIFEHFKTLTTDPEVIADLQQRIERLRAEDGCDKREALQNLDSLGNS